MRCSCIADFVDRINNCIQSRVKADCKFCTRDIIVDCARHPYTRISLLSQGFGAHVGAIPADYDKAVNAMLFELIDPLLLSFFCLELFASC
ncbi:Uncharacterised protein [Mycobacteroides abscessus subsp. abscessus]|nr:Uncharacterised protein [Mycobacteroides abscessus subsp. abscessus]